MKAIKLIENVTTEEPVDLATAKGHLNLFTTAHDAKVTRLITAARIHCERYMKRAILSKKVQLVLDAFEPIIQLPLGNVTAVNEVSYTDDAGDTIVLAPSDYQAALASEPARLAPAPRTYWPVIDPFRLGGVGVTYTVGWGAAANVPNDVISAILLVVGDLFEYTEESVSGTIISTRGAVASLLQPYVTDPLGLAFVDDREDFT